MLIAANLIAIELINYFFRKERLLKIIEDLEERAEVDIVMDEITSTLLLSHIQLYEGLTVSVLSRLKLILFIIWVYAQNELEQKKFEFDGVKSKAKQLIDADSSHEPVVKG